MARNPLAIRRSINLASALPPTSIARAGLVAPSKALKDFGKELRIMAAQTRNALVEDTIKEVQGQSKSFKPPVEFLAGKRVATPNLIRAAVMQFDHRPEAVQDAILRLAKGAGIPIDQGDYSEGFKVFVNGRESSPGLIKFGDRVELINVMPYARMLEVGKNDKGKPFVVQVRPNIVERIIARQMQNQWGKVMTAKFIFADIPDPYTLQTEFHRGRGRKPGHLRKDRGIGAPINYPGVRLET